MIASQYKIMPGAELIPLVRGLKEAGNASPISVETITPANSIAKKIIRQANPSKRPTLASLKSRPTRVQMEAWVSGNSGNDGTIKKETQAASATRTCTGKFIAEKTGNAAKSALILTKTRSQF